ncbi:MAG TPA: PEGA domain-containing protein [Kofleriaceae bacterium]
MIRILLIIAILTGVAHAGDRKAAERYFRAGAKAYAAQNFHAAAVNFDEAFKALPMPEIAFSAAQAFRRLYQVDPKPEYVRRAVELYQLYLREVKTGGRVGDAADNLAEMKRELAQLEAAGVKTTGTVARAQTRLGVNVSVGDQAAGELGALREIGDATGEATIKGLTASIDGKRVEPFALIDVDAKEHVIAVAADGYFPIEKKAMAVDGQATFVDIELRPMPAKLVVKTESDARILVDGRAAATAPNAPLEVPAGKHLLTVLRNGREPFAKELTVMRGEQLQVPAPLHKTGRRRAVPWVLGGAGLLAAGAITTGAFALLRDQRATDMREQIAMGNRPSSDADAYDSAVASRDRFAMWTWILGGSAVAAGGVGTLLLVFDKPSADGATVGLAGRF